MGGNGLNEPELILIFLPGQAIGHGCGPHRDDIFLLWYNDALPGKYFWNHAGLYCVANDLQRNMTGN